MIGIKFEIFEIFIQFIICSLKIISFLISFSNKPVLPLKHRIYNGI